MNVLDLVREDVGDAAVVKQSSTEYSSPCPTCGGRDRFRIYPDQGDGGTWMCRVCPPENGQRYSGGDLLQYLRSFRGMEWKEACALIGREPNIGYKPLTPPSSKKRTAYQHKELGDPEERWQSKAEAFVKFAHQHLLANSTQLAYLAKRGIPLEAVKAFKLGWNPKVLWRERPAWGLKEKLKPDGKTTKLWIPAGIVIPYYREDKLMRIRIRQKEGYPFGDKYIIVSGSVAAPMVVNHDAKAFAVIEAELDAIATGWAAPDDVGAIGLGSLAAKPDAWTHDRVKDCLAILNALDFEPPEGDQSEDDKKKAQQKVNAVGWWQKEYSQAKRWPVPQEKDPGEYVEKGGDLRKWLLAGLPPVLTLPSRKKSTAPPALKVQEQQVKRSPYLPPPPEVLRVLDMMQRAPLYINIDRQALSIGVASLSSWHCSNQENYRQFREFARRVMNSAVLRWIDDHPITKGIVDSSNLLHVPHESPR
ncbi:primase-helicase zinc-binding domain-containing protein [Halodesulfovibrio aestuarii]|uniref:Primase-helicase zinc-binding domain-containing protein n=1 Tax=Halodesulfovibrio aestuarii TaxID=126333 RepID=A0ABV4JXI3_9BACT